MKGRALVIHEGVGLVKVGVTVLGWWCSRFVDGEPVGG
jgi:hypothetical protein